jgi:hypothetical protein
MNRSKDTGGFSASMRRPDDYLWPKSVRVGGGAYPLAVDPSVDPSRVQFRPETVKASAERPAK